MDDAYKTRMDAIEKLIDERHARYEERAIRQEKAIDDTLLSLQRQNALSLVAVEKQTALALEAQRDSAHKAEIAQTHYNETHNDLLRRMDKQYDEMVTRREYVTANDAIREAIDELKKELSHQAGEKEAKKTSSDNVKWIIGLLAALIVGLAYHMFQH